MGLTITDEIFSKTQAIIAQQLKTPPARVTLPASMQNELGADSLDAMEIMMSIEEEFHIQIEEADARKMVTVRDIVDYVTKKTAAS